MVYVQRDAAGAIIGIYANPQPGYAEEALADDAPEVVAYRAGRVPLNVDRLAATRAEALTSLNTRADVTAVQVRALVEAIVYLINNRLESLGQKRVLAPEIFAYLAANPTIGDPPAGG